MKSMNNRCGWDEEVFLLPGEGSPEHFLPGEACPDEAEPGTRKIILKRRKAVWLPVGAGEIRGMDGRVFGGFCTVLCVLRSPRRFVIRNRGRLWGGEDPESILTNSMRSLLEDEIKRQVVHTEWRGTNQERRIFWESFRETLGKRLRENGWEAAAFRPGRIRATREGGDNGA